MKFFLKTSYLLDLISSVLYFTRIPVNWNYFSKKPPNLTKAAWSFPIIGFLVGILSGIFGDLCMFIDLPIFLSCVIAITFSIVLTGAFHEDGLADMADGFGAGGTAVKINKIMHDSRLGTYGTAALTLGLLIRLGLVVSLVELGNSLILILSVGFASGKLAIIFLRNLYKTSKFSKTGSIIENVSILKLILATILWFFPIYFFFPLVSILLGVLFIFVVIFLIGNMSKQKLGGLTGDVLGATAFISELAFLFALTIYLRIQF